MAGLVTTVDVAGPWSLATSKRFWEGFAPAPLTAVESPDLHTTFLVEGSWQPVSVTVSQQGERARISAGGAGDLEAAARQTCRFLSLDVDARGWPDVGRRDPVIGAAQRQLPGLRPCGFHSPYEAAAWAVLSQRIRITQAAVLRRKLIERHGDRGAFPAPATLYRLEFDLPGRKADYLRAVAAAAMDGLLDGAVLRSVPSEAAIRNVRQINGIGPFAAELIVIRGANAPDVLPSHERRLSAEIAERYGPDQSLRTVSERWRPYRSWAAVHLRAGRERRAAASRAGLNRQDRSEPC